MKVTGTITSVAIALLSLGVSRPGMQVFRSSTDEVLVPVSVKNGSVPVSGLGAKDFVLHDDGVLQQIEAVSAESIPLAVSLVLDASGSGRAALVSMQAQVRQMAALLRPGDQIRLITFAETVREIFSMRPASGRLDFDRLRSGGNTALNDAVAYALMRPADIASPHLVIVFTDGDDTASVLSDDMLPAIAARSDSMLAVGLVPSGMRPLASRQSLERAVAATGGETYRLSDTVEAFRAIVDAFHRGYVLRYQSTVGAKLGWHALTLRMVDQSSNWTIRTKAGYFAR